MDNKNNSNAGNILIVDDNAELREVMRDYLNSTGYSVSEAGDGKTAIEAVLNGAPPDAILLDIDLPDISGYDVCRLLKERDKSSDTPVIFVSGNTDTHSRLKAFCVGGAKFFPKPFKMKEIRDTLSILLARKAACALTA